MTWIQGFAVEVVTFIRKDTRLGSAGMEQAQISIANELTNSLRQALERFAAVLETLKGT
jgi:hypothetical protein